MPATADGSAAPDLSAAPDVPDVPVTAPDVPDVPPPIDAAVAVDVALPDAAHPDRPIPGDRPPPACRWAAGPLVDPVVAPAMAGYVTDVAPIDGGFAVLITRIGEVPAAEKIALAFVDADGRPTRAPLTFGTTMDSGSYMSLAARPGTGQIGVLGHGYIGGYLFLVAPDRTVRRVSVSGPSVHNLRILPTATGYSFVQALGTAPRLHRIDVDADGVTLGDVVIPIPVGPVTFGLGLGMIDPLLALQRATAVDGSSILVTSEAIGATPVGGVRVRVAYAVTPPGSSVAGVPSVFEDRDTHHGIAVMPGATGGLLAYVRAIQPSHSPILGADFTVQPVDLAGRPTTPAVTWSVPDLQYLGATASGTPRGPVVVIPVAREPTAPPGSADRHVALGIAADGNPEGDPVAMPFPADDPLFERAVVTPTPTGALVLALVTDRTSFGFRVVGFPLRCE